MRNCQWRRVNRQRATGHGDRVVAQLVGGILQRRRDRVSADGRSRRGAGAVIRSDVVAVLNAGDRAGEGRVGITVQTAGVGWRDRQRRLRNRQLALIQCDRVVPELAGWIYQDGRNVVRSDRGSISATFQSEEKASIAPASRRLRNAHAYFQRAGPTALAHCPVEPLIGIYTALTRKGLDGKPKGGWVPAQTIDLDTAIRAYTINGSFANFVEKNRGSITPGKYADLVMLSDDLFKIPAEKIKDTNITWTMVGGKTVRSNSRQTEYR